jgi:hypothetical protein
MNKIPYCLLLFVLSCNNNKVTNNTTIYFEGKDLWDKKCASCHSFLTFEGLNQTSLAQMRELSFDSLYLKLKIVNIDSNHSKKPLNTNNLKNSELEKIAKYIVKTKEPKP